MVPPGVHFFYFIIFYVIFMIFHIFYVIFLKFRFGFVDLSGSEYFLILALFRQPYGTGGTSTWGVRRG